MKILIVDDIEQNLYMLQILLEGHGYEVVSATNGAEALEEARRDPPDMIVTDILMPVMDGFTLCRKWKMDERLKEIPLVFYTATYTDPKDEDLALSLGAERFIVKPVEPDAFIGMLHTVIEEHREGRLIASCEPVEEEEVYFREYNEALIRKLEKKMLDIEKEITKRKRAEEALRQSEKRLEKINECLLSFGTDSNENINRLIALCGELLGATCALYNRLDGGMLCSWGQWNTPIDYNPVDKPDGHICYDVIESAGDQVLVFTNLLETHYARTDPNVIPFKLQTYIGRAVKLRGINVGSLCAVYQNNIDPTDEDKRIIEIIASAIGVEEERKRSNDALKESEEKYRTVLEANPDPVVVYDIEGKVIYFNPAFTRVFGWTLEERLGKKMDVFMPEEAWRETKMMIEKVLAGERFSGIETRRYNKKGEIIPVSISGAIYRDRDGHPLGSVINLRDISEQKKLESQLLQAQKMESLGTLAGGIAHDFNNLLMGIQGRTSMVLMDTYSSHPHSEHLKGIEDYVKSAANLTKQLLGFARGGKYEVKPTDLNELIKRKNQMFGRTKKEIKIREKFEKNLWTVDVDQGQIEQVLLNIYVNAWHAMPGGGDLYIQTENTTIDESYSKPYQVEPGKYVKISVTDTGVGMDEVTRQRIFDPFFTTKEMGGGTGLGLSSAYGIIKNHGGFINVYSEKGQGATFNIYLLVSGKEVIKEKKPYEEILRGTESVLLVDDEDIIIDVGQGIMEKLGYKVLIAKSGKEAIETYKKNQKNIDMVILDMIMPELDGGDTYDRLKEINPNIKALLSSGYSINGQAAEILERGCDGFIQKPFNIEKLSKKIRAILDKK